MYTVQTRGSGGMINVCSEVHFDSLLDKGVEMKIKKKKDSRSTPGDS